MAKVLLRPASAWVTRDRRWDFTDRPLLMGIVNVTPDSFSDGGRHADAAAAIAHGQQLIREGADLLDVGGESTRPGAEPVDAAELRRVLPVVEALAAAGAAVSIDTTKATVARSAIDAGAVVINDISAGRSDPEIVDVAAESDAGFIAMHMLGEPRTMQDNPVYQDVAGEVAGFLAERAAALEQAGIARECLAIDPGIGFGKTVDHNLTLLRHIDNIVTLGRPVVVGVSRKAFIGKLTGAPVGDRIPGTLAACLWAWQRGAHVLRVHDVAAARQAMTVWHAIAGHENAHE